MKAKGTKYLVAWKHAEADFERKMVINVPEGADADAVIFITVKGQAKKAGYVKRSRRDFQISSSQFYPPIPRNDLTPTDSKKRPRANTEA